MDLIYSVGDTLLRWLHIIASIVWMGLFYFLNLINLPYTKKLGTQERVFHLTNLTPIVFTWVRYSSLITVLTGFVLIYTKYWSGGDFISSHSAKTILSGGFLGTIMFLNVWFIIYPNQKRIIEATKKGEKINPEWSKRVLTFSRLNFALSFPMLFFMVSASHHPMDWNTIIITGTALALLGLGTVLYFQR